MRALVIAVLALLAAAMFGCGDGRPIGEAPSGQLRAAIGPHQDGGLRVALEALDYEGELSRRWYPARDRIEAVAGAGWWRSSSVEILIPAALAISVKDGQFVLEPLVEGFEDPCGLLSLRWSETAPSTPLQVGVVRDEACGIWSAPLSVTLPKEQLQLEAEIAVRLVGDCAEARIHVRRHGRQWRALPSGMVCGLDDLRTRPALTGASATWRSLASPVSAPYYEAPDVIEVRAGPLGLGVAIDGRVLDNVCGGIILQRGFQTIWRHRYDGRGCDWEVDLLEVVLHVEAGRAPADPLDQQQFAVYDWELAVRAALLPSEWRRPLPVERTREIVAAIYVDFFGSPDDAPSVREAPLESEYAGFYNPTQHEILLEADGLRANVVVHEAAHAMLRLALSGEDAFYLKPRHGPQFAAHLIALWERYAEGFDADSARRLAEVYGVHVRDGAPLLPAGDAQTRRAVQEALAPR